MEKRRYQIIYEYEKNHWWYKGRRFLLEKILKTIPQNPKMKILDIGCGGGFNLMILKKFGVVFGVDIEEQSINYCLERGFNNIKLVKNNNSLPFKESFFQLVTCLDVLEHIDDDKKYLKEVNRVLEKNGKLIIFTPAFNFLWSDLDEKSHHQRRYTKQQLINLLKSNGFTINSSFYFNFVFFIPILIIRLLQKLPFFTKTGWGIDPIIGSQFINRILTWIFISDVYLSKLISPPWGVSICVVATKK